MITSIARPLLWQYAIVAAVNLCSLSVGLAIGWSSPGLVKLRNMNETTLSRTITQDEGSWLVSFACLTAIAAIFTAAFLMDAIGRKSSIILAASVKVAMGVAQTLATEVWMVMTTRALLGGLDAVLLCVIPAYASEVASKEIRGALGVILNVFITFGIVMMLSVGPFCSYLTMNILYTAMTLVATVPLMFIPESPYFLYAKGRKEETVKILTLLRGSKDLVEDELKQYSLASNGQQVNRWQFFKDRTFLKSLGISLVFFLAGQLVGHNVIMAYLQSILELTDTNVRPEVASIIIGCVIVVASTCTFFFTDKFGRKPILTVTLTGTAIGLFGLGLFFRLQESGYDTKGCFSYLPILSFVLFYFSQGSGFSAISFIVISEMFDGPARATGMSVVLMLSEIVLFLSGRYFMTLVLTVGFPTVFWLFSVVSVLTCLFVALCVPETKGKSFAEIQEGLGAKKCEKYDNGGI